MSFRLKDMVYYNYREGGDVMKYPYMTRMDKTEITHGDVREDGTVLVYIETPVDWGFNSAYCVLPS